MFSTFEDIFRFFQDACNGNTKNLSCCIWIKSKDIISSLRDRIDNWIISTVKEFKSTSNMIRITFVNGSYIDILPPSSSVRGRRYFLSAYDNNIDLTTINNIIKPVNRGFIKSFSLYNPEPIRNLKEEEE